MNQQIGLHFGALSDSIQKQLTDQKFKFNTKQVEAYQAASDALLTLQFACLITDSARLKIQAKLYKRIVSHVCKENGLKQKI